MVLWLNSCGSLYSVCSKCGALTASFTVTGIDTYGTGRSPFFLEPSVIIIITDGGKLSSQQGVLDDVSICSFKLGELYNKCFSVVGRFI